MKKLYLSIFFHFLLFTFHLQTQWVQQPIPTSQQVQDIHFIDSLHGWLACSNGLASDSGLILYTSTGGTSWVTQRAVNSSPLYAVRMANLNTGFCVGGFQQVLKTTNSGLNWINVNTGFANYLNDVSLPNTSGDTAYIIDRTSGEGIWKTTNGGINFINVNPSAFGKTIFFINNQTGWAEVGNFNLVRTTNGGVNWVTLQTFPGSIGDIFFVNENTGWLNGGDSSGMLKTTNGGVNFLAQPLPSGSSGFGGLFFLNENTGWSGSLSFKVHKTTNAGLNWILYTGLPIFQTTKLWFVDALTGWCGNTGIAKTTNGGIMYLGQISTQIPKEYLLYQNYPNPFNPQTTIEFSLTKATYAELLVYDILGRELMVFKSDNLLAQGTHKFIFDADKLSSGTYFYKLIIKNSEKRITFSDTRKMILIK